MFRFQGSRLGSVAAFLPKETVLVESEKDLCHDVETLPYLVLLSSAHEVFAALWDQTRTFGTPNADGRPDEQIQNP